MVTWCGPGWVCAAQDGFLYCKVLIYLRNKVLGQTMSAEGSHRRHEVTLKKNLDSDEASLCKGQTVHKLPMIQKTSVLFCPWREEKGEHPQSLSLRSLRCAQSPSWQPGYTEEGVYDCDVCVFFLFGFCPFELGISDLTAYLLLVTFACLINHNQWWFCVPCLLLLSRNIGPIGGNRKTTLALLNPLLMFHICAGTKLNRAMLTSIYGQLCEWVNFVLTKIYNMA